jgi:hypothetical protein
MSALTHALELFFQLGHMLAFGDAEVVIRVIGLIHAIGRCGCTDGQYVSWALSSLCLPYFFYSGHNELEVCDYYMVTERNCSGLERKELVFCSGEEK